IVIRLEGKAFKYNLFHSLRAILSFGLLLAFAFGLGHRINAVIVSFVAIDIIILLFLIIAGNTGLTFKRGKFSIPVIKKLLQFGTAGLIANLSLLILTSSDRYIIALFEDMKAVGIYNQVYNIANLSIFALVTVYFNTINPTLNRQLEFDFKGSETLVYRYIKVFLLFGLPVITVACLFSREIAFVLLGSEFRVGYTIMPWVFMSSFSYGLSLFHETRLKFANKLRAIVLGVFISGLLNVLLNFILIPQYGYQAAAYTTFISYILLVLLFYQGDSVRYIFKRGFLLYFLKPFLILVILVTGHLVLKRYYTPPLLLTISEGILFLMIYIVLLRKKIKKIDFSAFVEK
ncbi:MAG: oligosaccharide flippase family protein, partial [Bacteroidales bacterium]|nr:oligosaccharide flippase family protein [Bacteroidales bacterium]